MAFNTAIFYDIENLLKGYSFSPETAANLSLSDILAAIKAAGCVGQIALQRAYANWSDPRLAIMRGEINELGIDPIQVFGFGREAKKNAADIQLAIDAVDLAHNRPGLEIFVIVSGDGGFSALAKKLHEYGKTVVGCAYRSSASRIFQAVCDHFVWLADPEADELADARPYPGLPSRMTGVTDSRNVRLAARIQPLEGDWDRDLLVRKAREVLEWYQQDPTARSDLNGPGIVLSVVQEALRYAAGPSANLRLGFPKFVEFLQHVCGGTPLCVVRRTDSQPVLAFRAQARRLGEILPDLPAREIHSPEVYRALLSAGAPIVRLPPASEVLAVARWIAEHPPSEQPVGALIEETTAGLQGTVASEAVKLVVLALIASGAFQRKPDGVPLADQTLTLRSEASTAEHLFVRLRNLAHQKLTAALGECRAEVLDQILPHAP
ncbi:MAG: NYN domain-containing protein [Bryobacteraceae bacterium]|nr:NYN domain-containing protein [Bryobacteraceae bacterium]